MEKPSEPSPPQQQPEVASPQPSHQIEYASPTEKTKLPRSGPLPTWEHVAVSALLCAAFSYTFGSLCAFEAINYLYIPMAYVLAAVVPPQNNETLICELARLLTGAVVGIVGALIFPLLGKHES